MAALATQLCLWHIAQRRSYEMDSASSACYDLILRVDANHHSLTILVRGWRRVSAVSATIVELKRRRGTSVPIELTAGLSVSIGSAPPSQVVLEDAGVLPCRVTLRRDEQRSPNESSAPRVAGCSPVRIRSINELPFRHPRPASWSSRLTALPPSSMAET
jgi:hypothetical protein